MPFVPVDEEIENEILRQLTTPKMNMPSEAEFQGSLNEEELKTLTPQNKLILLAISSLGKKIDFAVHWLCVNNHHARLNEAEMIRRRIDMDKKFANLRWKVKIGSWIVSGVGAGVLLELGIKIADNYIK